VEIDRDSDVPPNEQVAAWLRERIASGELASRLPSAVDISHETGVAIVTARKALRLLVDEGAAVMRPGWGTFVAPGK
jgi:DNA-binding GntR family transcriptional regulator